MSVPPKTDQDVPAPHLRTLPHFPVNEQGMRELEIWIKELLGRGKQFTGIFYNKYPQDGPKPRSWVSIKVTSETGPNSGGAFAILLGKAALSFRILNHLGNTVVDIEEDTSQNFFPGTDFAITLPLSGNFILRNHSNVPLVFITDGGDALLTPDADLVLNPVDDTRVTLRAAKDFIVEDSGNFPILTINEFHDGHYDLGGGNTYIINDGSNNPLVTYTG